MRKLLAAIFCASATALLLPGMAEAAHGRGRALYAGTSSAAAAGIVFDTATWASVTSGTTINVPHTVGSNSNRFMLTFNLKRRNAGQNLSTATWQTQPTVYVDDGNGTFIHVQSDVIPAPTSGVAVATFTFTGALTSGGAGVVISAYNVNASSAIRSYGNTSSDSATSLNLTLPTQSGDACFAAFIRSPNTTLTPDAGQGQLIQGDVSTEFTVMITSVAATGTTQQMGASWTGLNRIRMLMVCLKP